MENVQEFLKQLGSGIENSFQVLNPFSDKFFGKGFLEGINGVVNLLNPFSEHFFLKEVFRVLFEVDKGLLDGLKRSLDIPLFRAFSPQSVGGFRMTLAGHTFQIDIPRGVDVFCAGVLAVWAGFYFAKALPQMLGGDMYDI